MPPECLHNKPISLQFIFTWIAFPSTPMCPKGHWRWERWRGDKGDSWKRWKDTQDIGAERGGEKMEVVLQDDERNKWSEALTCSQHLRLSSFQQFLHSAKLQVILMALGIIVDTLGHHAYRSDRPCSKHRNKYLHYQTYIVILKRAWLSSVDS